MKTAIVVVVVVVVAVAAVLATLAAVGTFSHGGSSNGSASDVTVTSVRLALSAFPSLFSPASVNFTSGYPMHLSPGATWDVNWSFDNKYGDAGILSVSVNSPFVVDGTVPALPALFSSAGAGTLSILLRAPDDPGATLSANVTLVPDTPIGSAFAAGNPTSSTGAQTTPVACPMESGTLDLASNYLATGHYVFTLTVESSDILMSSGLFEVETSAGATDVATGGGGFYVVNIAGVAVAASCVSSGGGIKMSSPFSTYYNSAGSTQCNGALCSSSTPLANIYTIVIDVGTANPTGTGLLFVALGTNGYAGTTSPLSLP